MLLALAVGISILLGAAIAARALVAARDDWSAREKGSPRIGTIDYYGLRSVTEPQVRANLNVREGDFAPLSDRAGVITNLTRRVLGIKARRSIAERLEQIPGVARADVTTVIDAGTRCYLFVGIEEKNSPHFVHKPLPAGSITLPKEMVEAYDQHLEAFASAIANRDPEFDEDDSQGHALFTDARMRALEEKMIVFDASRPNIVRQVLNDSATAHQRAAAAWIIGYSPDKRVILGDLMEAVRDPDAEVRNNATRAIAIIAEFSNQRPELGIHIDPSVFIEMLNSLTWTDRNKATGVLHSLTEGSDVVTLRLLRERALPTLVEMARWKAAPYALEALELLGRIAGFDEKEIQSAWNSGERERIIAMATMTNGHPLPATSQRP
jgi:hypothetical protein